MIPLERSLILRWHLKVIKCYIGSWRQPLKNHLCHTLARYTPMLKCVLCHALAWYTPMLKCVKVVYAWWVNLHIVVHILQLLSALSCIRYLISWRVTELRKPSSRISSIVSTLALECHHSITRDTYQTITLASVNQIVSIPEAISTKIEHIMTVIPIILWFLELSDGGVSIQY